MRVWRLLRARIAVSDELADRANYKVWRRSCMVPTGVKTDIDTVLMPAQLVRQTLYSAKETALAKKPKKHENGFW